MKPKSSIRSAVIFRSFFKASLMLLLAVSLLSAQAFAGGESSKAKALESLKKEFQNAGNIQWKVTPDYLKARFQWNNQTIEVFYDYNGETIAKSRVIQPADLPLKAQQSMAKKYDGYATGECIEYSGKEGNNYYVSVTKGDDKKILQVTPEGEISVFKKM